MWDIYMGHTEDGFVSHWKIVFEHDPSTEDESCECPEGCEDDDCDHQPDNTYFELDKTDEIVPLKSTHIVHVTQNPDDSWFFQHVSPRAISDNIVFSDSIGTCSDRELPKIIHECGRYRARGMARRTARHGSGELRTR